MVCGVASQRRREGPIASKIYNFDNNFNLEEMESVSDNHIDFLSDRGDKYLFFK